MGALNRPRGLIVWAALWLAAVAAGMSALWRYKTIPGGAGAAPGRWPAASVVGRSRDLPTLVLAAHPRCPCTRASLSELAVIMARLRGRMEARILFYKPEDSPAGWERTGSWRAAAAIPGVSVQGDPGGAEAARFGALTSGYALLYDARGRLLFSGGITGARGHAGGNKGRDAVIALGAGAASGFEWTSVFGCSLAGERRAGDAGGG